LAIFVFVWKRRNRMKKPHKQLFIILIIFILPVIASWVLFHYHTLFHLKTSNYGTFTHAPIDVTYLYSGNAHIEQKKWTILYITSNNCDNECQQINHQLQQVQKALGKNRDRVTILLIKSNNTQMQKLKILLNQQENPSFVMENKIYLIDPLGNLFMYYPEQVNPMNILKDLQHLLEVSQIG
jgi:hypothetical protein